MNIQPGNLTLSQLRKIHSRRETLTIDPTAVAGIRASAALVQQAAHGGAAVYGVNTGFGKLANQRIAQADLEVLQLNLLRSHAVGVGEPMPERVVRLVLLLKAASLARGYSGVREVVIDTLIALYNKGLTPVIPCQGSVGASGDLAPLAHLCLPLIGEGEVFYQGKRMAAVEALEQASITPVKLSAKEGLALINGTQVSTALALDALLATDRLFEAAVISGAVTLDAARGSDGPFDPRIHAVRGQPGQIDCAAAYRAIMVGSEIRRSHLEGDNRVQDPYCLRCQPQVMGACLDQVRNAAAALLIEANAVSDNPLVFPEAHAILSGGNFHAEPVAFAADNLALAIAEVGALSERRTALLMDTHLSGLPPFLVEEGGVNSGFMIAQVTAAALAAENKALAHPRSVDSLPTSANQEDHVSMATGAASRLAPMAGNTAAIVAIELLAAAQGIDLRKPLQTSSRLHEALALVRESAAFWDRDRAFAPDLAAMRARVEAGAFRRFVGLGSL